ncbi:hypothetical protein NM208_g1382 [Fusarium decemcellulare]|uniref:Uncharacterized protein n=1 Tax=Fusarium decemcellulare TaxID=57161 RepID=A0ACC1SWD6_9HYPO|nr:hypothetical protein NM208_g1382 [Fusarium decemcellulare]
MTARTQILDTPEGISFYHQSDEEARWLYDEIFKERCYDTVRLPEKPLIIDAGANIGLFTLFAKKNYPAAQIMAFEPASENVEIMKQNISLHKLSDVEIYECALGSKNETRNLTFFPNTPSNATLCTDEKDQWLKFIADKISPEIADRMGYGARETPVSVKRLSDFLHDRENLTRVDLLKIDVEGGELDVIEGVDDKHLPLIQNIVMEVWDPNGQLEAAKKALQSKGYTVEASLVPWKMGRAETLKMYMVTARRTSTEQS